MMKLDLKKIGIELVVFSAVAAFCAYSAKNLHWVPQQRVLGQVAATRAESYESAPPDRSPASNTTAKSQYIETIDIGCIDTLEHANKITGARQVRFVGTWCKISGHPKIDSLNITTNEAMLTFIDTNQPRFSTSYFPLAAGLNKIQFNIISSKKKISKSLDLTRP